MTWACHDPLIRLSLEDARRLIELEEIQTLAAKMKAVHPFWCRPGIDDTRCACGLADLRSALERMKRHKG